MTITEDTSTEEERVRAFLEPDYGPITICARQSEGMFDKDLVAIAFELDGISYRARYHERSGEKWFSFAPGKVSREIILGQRNLYRAELNKLLAFLCGITDND
ncbi:MAG: hypothetical protein AAF732_23295 [Pseudomonadota bacterium]